MNTKILALVGLLTLAACGGAREPPAAVTAAAPAAGISAEMAWARAALDRNPEFEVLATDTAAGVFTIRNHASGEVRTVKLADLALAPAGSPEAPANESVAVDAEAASVADEAVSSDTQALPTDAEPALDYKVERSGGQVRVSGPGVSIVSATGPAAATAHRRSDHLRRRARAAGERPARRGHGQRHHGEERLPASHHQQPHHGDRHGRRDPGRDGAHHEQHDRRRHGLVRRRAGRESVPPGRDDEGRDTARRARGSARTGQ
jgi:hypothetical protein